MLFLKLLVAVGAAFAILSLFVGPRRAWELWQRFGHAVGDAVARIVLTVFYFSVLVPFALFVRASRDPLGVDRTGGKLWLPHAEPRSDLESAGRQY